MVKTSQTSLCRGQSKRDVVQTGHAKSFKNIQERSDQGGWEDGKKKKESEVTPPPTERSDERTGGALQATVQKGRGFGDQIRYVDTPMKRIYREITQGWQPIMVGHQPPDFKMMREVAFSEHDNTSFPTTTRFQYDNVPPPTGRGSAHDSPDTAHYVGGVLKNISPELYALYHGGAGNSVQEHEYKTRVPRGNVIQFDRRSEDLHGRSTKW